MLDHVGDQCADGVVQELGRSRIVHEVHAAVGVVHVVVGVPQHAVRVVDEGCSPPPLLVRDQRDGVWPLPGLSTGHLARAEAVEELK